MFALRGQLLPSMGRHRSVPFRSPIAISVAQRSDDDGLQHQQHQQQVRQYGRTRRHALRKKRAASGVASTKTGDTASAGAAEKDATAAFTTSSNAHTAAAAAAATTATAASVLNLNNLKVSSNDGPTMEVAQSMPINYAHMDNISLLTLSAMNNEKARAEMLRRHIMVIDNVSYSEACLTFKKIDIEIRKGMFVHSIPYKLGIIAAGGAAVGSIPLCFHLPTVEWFNEFYVTTDVPPPEDLETWLEVGKKETDIWVASCLCLLLLSLSTVARDAVGSVPGWNTTTHHWIIRRALGAG